MFAYVFILLYFLYFFNSVNNAELIFPVPFLDGFGWLCQSSPATSPPLPHWTQHLVAAWVRPPSSHGSVGLSYKVSCIFDIRYSLSSALFQSCFTFFAISCFFLPVSIFKIDPKLSVIRSFCSRWLPPQDNELVPGL